MATENKPNNIDQWSRANVTRIETGKWLIAILGAVGAVIIAGIQISSIGKFTPWHMQQYLDSDALRFFLAISATAVGLVFVGLAIRSAVKIMTPSIFTDDDLFHNKEIRDYLKENPNIFRRYGDDIDVFLSERDRLFADWKGKDAVFDSENADDAKLWRDLEDSAKKVEMADRVASTALRMGAFHKTSLNFNSQISYIFLYSTVVALAALVFTVVLEAPQKTEIQPLSGVEVILKEKAWQEFLTKAGTKCQLRENTKIYAITTDILDNDKQARNVITLPLFGCKPVQIEISDELGSVSETLTHRQVEFRPFETGRPYSNVYQSIDGLMRHIENRGFVTDAELVELTRWLEQIRYTIKEIGRERGEFESPIIFKLDELIREIKELDLK